jgi:tetratricopeptide (TPR) repeat protein
MEMDRAADALKVYEAALRIKPNYLKALCNYATALIALKRPQEALDNVERALTVDPGYYDARVARGNVLVKLNRDLEALKSYDTAISLKPTAWLPHNNKGLTLIQSGRIEEGNALLERAIELAPQSAEAYYNLAQSKRFGADDAAIGAMQELARQAPSSDTSNAIKLNFALGKAFDDLRDYQQAFNYLSAGNVYKRRALQYDEPGVLGCLDRTRLAYTADFIRNRSGFGDTSEVPVFMVGMPRSGSTLVEQI